MAQLNIPLVKILYYHRMCIKLMAFSKMYYEHLLVIHSARKKLECSRASPVVAQTPGYRPKAGCLWSCHALGSAWVKCSSCSALGCRPDDVRREERQAEQAVDEAAGNVLGVGDVRRRTAIAIFRQPLQTGFRMRRR